MNPINQLTGMEFEDLDYLQLFELIQAYCDQNKYFDVWVSFSELNEYPKAFKNTSNLIFTFQNTVGNIDLLKEFFNYWTV